MSAQLHRERQKAFVDGLQAQVAALSAERDMLRAVIAIALDRGAGEPGAQLHDVVVPRFAEEIALHVQPPSAQAGKAEGVAAY